MGDIATLALPIPEAVSFEEPPPFSDQVHGYAAKIRAGEVVEVDDVLAMKELADGMWYDDDGVLQGLDSQALDSETAELVWRWGTAEAWVLSETEVRGLRAAAKLFAGKQDELDMTGAEAEFAMGCREWVGAALGIANPYRMTFDQLAVLANRRCELSTNLIEQGFVQPVAARLGRSLVLGLKEEEASSREDPIPLAEPDTADDEDISITQPVPPDPKDIPEPLSVLVLSRPPEKRRWGKRLVAAAVIGALCLAFVSTDSKVSSSGKPSVGHSAQAEATPQPGNTETQSPVTEEPTADHMVVLDDYDWITGAGTVEFAAVGYASELGYQNLTPWQTHVLTERALEYLGLDNEQAKKLSSGQRLALPNQKLMRQWLQEIVTA